MYPYRKLTVLPGKIVANAVAPMACTPHGKQHFSILVRQQHFTYVLDCQVVQIVVCSCDDVFSNIATINSLKARDFQAVIKIGLRIRSICLISLPCNSSSVLLWLPIPKISTKRKASALLI